MYSLLRFEVGFHLPMCSNCKSEFCSFSELGESLVPIEIIICFVAFGRPEANSRSIGLDFIFDIFGSIPSTLCYIIKNELFKM